MTRPDCIKNYIEIQEGPNESYYQGSQEYLSRGSPFGKAFDFKKLGIHHELLPPGRRTSYPHSEENEEEFIYVIDGAPDAWINGSLHRLQSGDGVGFPAGTGTCHTFINNTESDVRLLVVGEKSKKDSKIYYPLHPNQRERRKDIWWHEVPKHEMGLHDGLPDKLRGSAELGPLNFTGEVTVENVREQTLLAEIETYRIHSRKSQEGLQIHRYCIDEPNLKNLLSPLGQSLKSESSFIYFHSDLGTKLYVIFKTKNFAVTRPSDDSWNELVRHAKSVGLDSNWIKELPESFKRHL